jgi:succinate dehydrogenase/fumarate reductase cytochrome b subunit
MGFEYGGIFGLLLLAADIWALINIIQSTNSNNSKVIWVIAVILLPLLGVIAWFFAGPRKH